MKKKRTICMILGQVLLILLLFNGCIVTSGSGSDTLSPGGSFLYDGVIYLVDGLNLLDKGANGTVPESHNLNIIIYTASPSDSTKVWLDLDSSNPGTPATGTYNWAGGVCAPDKLFDATIDIGSGAIQSTTGWLSISRNQSDSSWFQIDFFITLDTGKQATGSCEGHFNVI